MDKDIPAEFLTKPGAFLDYLTRTRGDVYPEGPYRNSRGVQRGSVMNGAGDPTTPGYASVRGAPRQPLESLPVPRIPVLPLSYGNAIELLRDVRGADIPQSWQGGLPFRYHAGPGPVRARVQVFSDSATAAYKPIWNTYGIIRGSEFPDELVIIGAHRDAWSPGAVDNVSGTVSVVESARAVAAQMRAAGGPTHVWTINDLDVATRLWARGVSGIITDDPAMMLSLRQAAA